MAESYGRSHNQEPGIRCWCGMTHQPTTEMSDGFERLEREQIQTCRDLAAKLDKGGPYSKARAQRLREQADRMEQQIASRNPAPVIPVTGKED